MTEEVWNIDCSDDELREVQTSWEPPPEKIEQLYNMLEQGEIPELQWKSPGMAIQRFQKEHLKIIYNFRLSYAHTREN